MSARGGLFISDIRSGGDSIYTHVWSLNTLCTDDVKGTIHWLRDATLPCDEILNGDIKHAW
jgi:hypothetical protein